MELKKRLTAGSLLLLILFGLLVGNGEDAAAQDVERRTTIIVPYIEYEWWLIRWSDNEILCRFLVDHEGLPTEDEVRTSCGGELHEEWRTTPPCEFDNGRPVDCAGLYLFLASSRQTEKEVVITLPSPEVFITLDGCMPDPPENLCAQLPALAITAQEPLPNEAITAIHGLYAGNPFTCEGSTCRVPLSPTPFQGVTVEFWAESSFGDTSQHYTAQVRAIDTGVPEDPGEAGWFVDVISSQWRGPDLASCVRTWQSFPPVGGPPAWLLTPESEELLATEEPYYYLAGRLITQGLVDASGCSTGGLLPNGYADACGLEQARPQVEEWQNRFDARIIEVAEETGIPAQLMKNLFAQESQFWPGVFRVPFEYGLGQMTDNGAETILLWNNAFYTQFCPLILSEETCGKSYLGLNAEHKAMLRGALAVQVKADCPECPAGIDLSNVDFSLPFFANTLQANCDQVAQIVYNATEAMPGAVSSYEDLWRFTVANYHAGPGCLSYAVHSAWRSGNPLNWEQVANRFTEPCQGVVPYVEKITQIEP